MDPVKTVVREALLAQRKMYEVWVTLLHTSDAERELAAMKIGLIDVALKEGDK
jgi:hypothetical protein